MTDPNAEITVDHIAQAVEWAKTAGDTPKPIDGCERRYAQSSWDCGTSCCIWGAAHLIARGAPTKDGPDIEWASDAKRKLLYALMLSGTSTPAMFEAVLSRDDLRDADLRGANLSDADLRGANLSGADLSDADLSDANLSDADLSDADLCGADLCGANLCGANLRGADLSGANLSDANLSDADLRGADLRGADLRGADLSGADLSDADLSGADLSDATILVGNVYRFVR